ncbi:unnamed protein product [Amoebophrya sp. A25]|nr:unnamed protein product [Amoebophrya sp. A25]|eukprot:GSA25T00019684001.1
MPVSSMVLVGHLPQKMMLKQEKDMETRTKKDAGARVGAEISKYLCDSTEARVGTMLLNILLHKADSTLWSMLMLQEAYTVLAHILERTLLLQLANL